MAIQGSWGSLVLIVKRLQNQIIFSDYRDDAISKLF